jgi:hypothetical protein
MAASEFGNGECGSWRRITCITPDTFTRPIKIVSTCYRAGEAGETAIAEQKALNYFCIDFAKLKWQIVEKHETEDEALAAHARISKETEV